MELYKSNIFKHSYIDLVNNSAKLALNYGDIAINFSNKGLYTKLQNSKISRIGNSVRKLIDLQEYVLGVASSNLTYSLLKVLYNEGIVQLTTAYPFISIQNISGTNINTAEITSDTYNYLSFNNSGQVINTSRKEYNLSELADVVTNIGKVQSNNNFVLTTSYNTTTPGKDPFKTTYYYTWSLKPEASQIKLFDDVVYTTASTNNVFRAFRIDEATSDVITNTGLSIFWDVSPTLSADLNCAGNSIVHQIYSINPIVLTNAIETIDCDLDKYNFYYIDCTNVHILNINIKYSANFVSEGLKCNGLIINNFTGAITFNSTVEYENGIAPIYTGSLNMFNLLTYQDAGGIITRVLHKSLDLLGFQ